MDETPRPAPKYVRRVVQDHESPDEPATRRPRRRQTAGLSTAWWTRGSDGLCILDATIREQSPARPARCEREVRRQGLHRAMLRAASRSSSCRASHFAGPESSPMTIAARRDPSMSGPGVDRHRSADRPLQRHEEIHVRSNTGHERSRRASSHARRRGGRRRP